MNVSQFLNSDFRMIRSGEKLTKKQNVARRQPMQARARNTRELIFEAALQILDQEGEAALTTNRIAERSGFSVGTIYQYFANKQEILSALIAQERHARVTRIAAEISAWKDQAPVRDPLRGRVRAILRIVLDAFGGRHKARRILVEYALRGHDGGVMNRPVAEIANMLCGLSGGPRDSSALGEIEAFVLAQAVSGAIHAALFRNPQLLKNPRFERALLDLSTGFLQQRRANP